MASHHPQTVIVTGASAGVGRAVAHRFARAGARIGLIARDEQALDEVRLEVEEAGGEALVLPLDVADADAMFEAADKVERAFGPIDVWVNGAMVTVFSPVSEMNPEEFRRVTEVTYLGFVHGTMAALRTMRPRDRGTIVQVGSALAFRGIPLQSSYCGAKYAIRGFTDSLRSELIHENSGVHVTMVHLPGVNTPQFDWARAHVPRHPRPMPPVIEPEVAADAVFKAAHQRKRDYWLGLQTAQVILGNALLPRFLDRYLARNAWDGQMTAQPLTRRRDNLETPVHALHRTRGSFENEASDWAVDLPGPGTRLAAVATGIVGVGALVLLGRRLLRS